MNIFNKIKISRIGYNYLDWLSRDIIGCGTIADMPTIEQKSAFSERLLLALRRSHEAVEGATDLAIQFSLRYSGAAVSPQTAHKWLSGRAVPTEDKLDILAEWLNVDKHWLHYGPPPKKPVREGKTAQGKSQKFPSEEAVKLALMIQSLPPHKRYLIEELVAQFQD